MPPAPIRELRDLTRYRKTLIQERVRETQRLQKVLENAGIKRASVATDILGVSGRAMLEALVHGTTSWPEDACESNCRLSRRPSLAAFDGTMRSWSVTSWRIWTIWQKRWSA